jgi:tRNA threonylcarbamoyl adenosine modification protein YeaZ
MSAWAVLLGDHDRTHLFTTFRDNRAITTELAGMVKGKKLTAVAVATGPGSFTGLRVGVSFGLGLAMGLRIPIIPLPSLDLQAARARVPAIALMEAGRGRAYYQLPGGQPMLGDAAGIPSGLPLVGNVAPKTEAALIEAGHRFIPADELKDHGEAAKGMLEGAREVPYGSLKIEYMQTFSARN